jgi:FkbM family methyltransferase
MKKLKFNQQLLDAIIWKARQKYSQFRCYLGGGRYIWQVEKGIQFVSCQDDAFSHVLYVCRGHEKAEMNWCRQWINLGETEQSVIDCGANIGYFSAILAQACSLHQILAIEGNQRTAELCKQNLHTLGIKNVTVVQAVLSASLSDQYIIPDRLGKEPWQQAIKADSISDVSYTTTLDNLINEFKIKPSLVKIDCEGFETFILRGADNLLGSLRPALMIECNDIALKSSGTDRNELFQLLEGYNYRLFHLSSFTGSYQFGIELYDNFPASEFNFAAIPNDDFNLNKWNKSVQLLSE